MYVHEMYKRMLFFQVTMFVAIQYRYRLVLVLATAAGLIHELGFEHINASALYCAGGGI